MNQDTTLPHIPVLFDEIISAFSTCKDGYIIDCTAGFGGHSKGLLKNNPDVKLICNDQDIEAFYYLKNHLKPFKDRIIFNKSNFNVIYKSDFNKEFILKFLEIVPIKELNKSEITYNNKKFASNYEKYFVLKSKMYALYIFDMSILNIF